MAKAPTTTATRPKNDNPRTSSRAKKPALICSTTGRKTRNIPRQMWPVRLPSAFDLLDATVVGACRSNSREVTVWLRIKLVVARIACQATFRQRFLPPPHPTTPSSRRTTVGCREPCLHAASRFVADSFAAVQASVIRIRVSCAFTSPLSNSSIAALISTNAKTIRTAGCMIHPDFCATP